MPRGELRLAAKILYLTWALLYTGGTTFLLMIKRLPYIFWPFTTRNGRP